MRIARKAERGAARFDEFLERRGDLRWCPDDRYAGADPHRRDTRPQVRVDGHEFTGLLEKIPHAAVGVGRLLDAVDDRSTASDLVHDEPRRAFDQPFGSLPGLVFTVAADDLQGGDFQICSVCRAVCCNSCGATSF